MLQTVHGVCGDGRVELAELPPDADGARVLVTFLPKSGTVDLQELGIGPEEAAELRWRFGEIAEDWNRPEMDVYDEP